MMGAGHENGVFIHNYMDGRRKLPWDEEVDSDDIIYSNIELASSGVLTARCKRELEKLYN